MISKKFYEEVFLILLIFSLLIFPLNSLSQEKNKKEKPKLSSLGKSILVPGWGQLAEKRYVEGVTFLGLELAALAGIITNAKESSKYYKKYQQADNVLDAIRYRELTEKYDIRRNKFILAAGVVWALNLVDMYWIHKKKEKNHLIIFGVGSENQFYIAFVKSF
ncbi:MAG: hypothetical protein ACE5WD_10780 [Candidatus Aminicenantia bacterium]